MISRARAAALAALALTLAGCSGGGDEEPTSTATSPKDAKVLQPGKPGEPNTSLSGTSAVASPSTSHNSADVDFLQDMITHHAQAVVMGDLAKDELTDPKVKAIASRISAEQKPEMRGMAKSLRAWKEKVPPQAENPTFGAHGGHSSHASMPGMATQQQLDELADATGADADRLYLDLMIAHHEGALTMCTTLSRKGSDERTGELGDDIAVSQSKQIEQMKDMRRRL